MSKIEFGHEYMPIQGGVLAVGCIFIQEDHIQMGVMWYCQLGCAVWWDSQASLGNHVNPSLIISTLVPRPGKSRWCISHQIAALPTRFQPDQAFVVCTEPEPVAKFSLQSWSATISVICICLWSLSHFLAHWSRAPTNTVHCQVFSFTWA